MELLAKHNPNPCRFENVMKPFLLLHVNRYAGKTADSQLVVKGVRSMWRQSAPIVANCLQVRCGDVLNQKVADAFADVRGCVLMHSGLETRTGF